MGEKTEISWTTHTFNSWWGCSRIAPGCDNCYAATLDARTGGDYWNPRTAPRRTIIENRRRRVFCGSMMDWCDKDAPVGAREDLFKLIRETQMLDWQLLTKRATLIKKNLPADWGNGYQNVWLGVTVENKEFGFPRIDALREIPAKIKFISAEPLLSSLNGICLEGIDWVIIGGESGPGWRQMNRAWVDDLMSACAHESIPVWFKQWGGNTKGKGGCEINGREHKFWPKDVMAE